MEPPQKRKRSFTLNKMKYSYIIILIGLFMNWCFAECDSSFTYFDELPGNVTILVGDSCLNNDDIAVLDSIVVQNELEYNSPLELGTQTWFNGRLRFLVAGNYGNSSGVNDTIYVLPDNFGDLNELASLYLEWNRISELPESFSNLSGLFSVYLNNNILSSIGDSIGNLSNLYFLDLGYNHFIVLYNIWGEATTPMLFFKIDEELWDTMKSFVIFLNRMPEYPRTSMHDVKVDLECLKELYRDYNEKNTVR